MLLRLFIVSSVCLLSACSGIKVGNIDFTTAEICSEEYARKTIGTQLGLTKNIGCLPTQRHENIKEFHFTKIRPLVPINDIIAINDKSDIYESIINGSSKETGVETNVLPSFIGQLVRFKYTDGQKVVENLSGSFNFTDTSTKYLSEFPTQILLSSEITASEDKTKVQQLDINVGNIVSAALTGTQISSKTLKAIFDNTTLAADLEAVMANYKSINNSSSVSLGKFQYISLDYNVIDQLAVRLNSNINRNSDISDTQDDLANIRTTPATSLCENNATASALCNENKLKAKVEQYSNAINTFISKHNTYNTYGLIVGASIINTSGFSAQCSQTMVGAGNNAQSLSVTSCQTLRDNLKNIISKNYSAVGVSLPSGASPSDKNAAAEEAAAKIINMYIGATKSTYKELRLAGHTSVLAIHYIPLAKPQ